MSHTHEDRVADRPPHLCAAYGCPLIGTSTSSTSGSDEWWCFAHFGADVGRYQAITAELNRMQWLSGAARDVRFHKPGTAESKAAFSLIEHELELHKRPDLQWNRVETRMQWLLRLESAVRAVLSPLLLAPVQASLVGTSQSAGTFAKVGFDMPE